MADYAFKGYENFILEDMIEDNLSTKLDVNKFMTADYSLQGHDGMKKLIHRYTGTGVAEDLARGEKNSQYADADFVSEEYEVARTQSQARYFDDDAMRDPVLIDAKVGAMSDAMINAWTAKAIAEFGKTSKQSAMTNWDLADFADAISKYVEKYESQEGLFILANIKLIPTIRKVLGDYLKYTEAYIRTGAVGDILGVPIYTSKAVPEGIAFLATKDAVTAFIKKDVFVEQARDIDSKENQIVASRYSVIALTDENKCIKLGAPQATAATITTKAAGAKVVAGAATTGATVKVFVNGELFGSATAANSAYSVTGAANLVAGDNIKVVASVEGKLDSVVEDKAA
jgi:hypothetical protein